MTLVAGLFTAFVVVQAQTSYQVSTVAGWQTFGTRDGVGAAAQFAFAGSSQPDTDTLIGMVRDSSGNIFLSDIGNSTIRKITPTGVVTTFAGQAGSAGFVNETGTAARFSGPRGLAIDETNNLYVSDYGNSAIRKVTPAGVVTTWYAGPEVGHALALVPDGSIVTGERSMHALPTGSPRLFRISTSGLATPIAGGSRQSPVFPRCVDGTGAAAEFMGIFSIVRDPANGDFIVGDGYTSPGFPRFCSGLRRVTLAGVVTTLPGSVGLNPAALVFDDAARLLIVKSDAFGGPLFVGGSIAPRLRVLVGSTVYDVTSAFPPGSYQLVGMVRAADGSLVVATSESTLYRLTLTDAGTPSSPGPFSVTAIALAGRPLSCAGEMPMDGSRLETRFCDTRSVAFDATGVMYVVDASYSRDVGTGGQRVAGYTIRKMGLDGQSSTLAGRVDGVGSTDGPGSAARFGTQEQRTDAVLGLAASAAGVVYVADQANSTIRQIAPDGTTTTLAGVAGSTGTTDGTGTAARLNRPHDVALDSAGNLFVADTGNSSIRRITPAGQVTTFAGTSGVGGSTDGAGSVARFSNPYGITIGPGNIVYVADTGNHVIRKIMPDGQVTTLAGQAGTAGAVDGTGTAAQFNTPRTIAVDASGTVFVGDRPSPMHFWRIRRISSSGVVTTVLQQIGEIGDVDASGLLYLVGGPTVRVASADTPAAPTITTPPASQTITAGQPVTFTAAANGSPSPSYRWHTSADGGSTWTIVSDGAPYSGATTSSLSVSTTTMAYPLRQFRAVATNVLGSATSNAAVLTVPGLLVAPSSLRFRVTKAGAPGAIRSHPSQDVLATFVGVAPGTLTWSANQPWVQLTPLSGGAAVQVGINDPNNVLFGSASASAVITASGGGRTATVSLALEIVLDPNTTSAPIGQVDTPTQNATSVRGAIALSGWATDDIGIADVKIYRNCLSAEPQANCQTAIVPGSTGLAVVYVGTAQLVPGARPDIDSAFPQYSSGTRAGWGYLLLTSLLPRTTGTFSPYGGQGAVTLYVVATDSEGKQTLLGRNWSNDATPTTISLDNDAIAKPFGTIDTPAEGQRLTSTSFNNFGWVLTPDSDTVTGNSDIEMATASGLTLFIDGLPITAVTYNQCRGTVGNPVPGGTYCNDDVANIFGNTSVQGPLTPRTSNPTKFRNLDAGRGAMGSTVVDIRGLANGLHTIAWSATDSASRVEGIGSRYFSVLREQTAPAQRGEETTANDRVAMEPALPASAAAREGFDLRTPFVPLDPDRDGVRRVRISTLGRVELTLGGAVVSAGIVINDIVGDLPVGSFLDAVTGQFTWMPGPAFLGTYRLQFVSGGERFDVDVTIAPSTETAAGESEIRMETPTVRGCETMAALDCNVGGPVTLTGQAWDPQAFTGSGIGVVHVWGLRRDQPTAVPVFLGVATLGADHTYTFTSSLDRGMWDVTAYVWNIRTGRFEDARTVRVTVR